MPEYYSIEANLFNNLVIPDLIIPKSENKGFRELYLIVWNTIFEDMKLQKEIELKFREKAKIDYQREHG